MTTLSEATRLYIESHTTVRASRTKNGHLENARMIAAWMGRDPDVSELTDAKLKSWWETREKQVSRNTVNGEGVSLIAILKWAHQKGWREWPDARPPSRIKRTPQALTREQTIALVRAADSLTGNHGGIPARIRWRAFLMLAIATGERGGAIKQMHRDDLNLDVVTFRAETRKGGCTEAVHVVPPQVVAALNELWSYQETHPFKWLTEGGLFYGTWAALRAMAGLPEWCKPHTLRKTAASHCRTLKEAQELLGHASPHTTAQVYRDPRIAKKETPHGHLIDAIERPPMTLAEWLATPARRLLRRLTG